MIITNLQKLTDMKHITTLFLALTFLLFACSKHKKQYKNIDVIMSPMGLAELSCTKEYAANFFFDGHIYLVESIADKYKNSLTFLPVNIDFKVTNTVYCTTDTQFNAELYEVEIQSIKDR